jgi:predicted GNAT family acetyltransferase
MENLGPAFGFFPQMKPRRQGSPADSANLPIDVLRGRLAGLLGAPADIANLLRSPSPTEMFGEVNYEAPAQFPYTTEKFLKELPLAPTSRVGQAAGQAASFVPLNPMPAVRGVQKVGQVVGEELAATMMGQRPNTMMSKVVPQPLFAVAPEGLLSYRGSHTAPDRDFGAPLHDLTGGGQMYPADIYSSKAAQLYGGGMPYDQKAFSIAQQYKDKPNALVTIYRAVPKDISNSEKLATLEKQMAAYMKRGTLPKDASNYSDGSKWYDAAYDRREALRKMPDEPSNEVNKINAGDWVTLTREYAKDHGESALNGEYKIISQKVKAKDVFTNADSIHEFGYQPQMAKPSQIEAPRQEALDKAQRNAALPVEEQPMQGLLDIAKRDASDIFGEGAQRIRYTDPKSSGSIEVLARPDNTASVLGLEVPETFRGQGIGGLLQSKVLQDFPDMQGQVSSKAAATTAYRLGRRPPNMPDATLDDVYKMIDENSSVNLVSPKMQQRIAPIPETEEDKLLRSLLE